MINNIHLLVFALVGFFISYFFLKYNPTTKILFINNNNCYHIHHYIFFSIFILFILFIRCVKNKIYINDMIALLFGIILQDFIFPDIKYMKCK